VTWGIRPEHLAIGREAEGGGLLVEVAVIEPTGAETQVLARAGGVTLDAVVRERVRAEPGTALRLRVDPALVHLFDGATGLRI
jgi:multiple sugar transport system ATP-binding protein